MNLLAVDVGNTEITIGVFRDAALAVPGRFATDPRKTADEYALLLAQFLHSRSQDPAALERVAVACVVPPLLETICETATTLTGRAPFVVRPGIKTGVPIRTENPTEVGADRIVNTAACVARHGAPAVVVDFGTATTFDVISARGEYLGGIIAPGIGISAEALFRAASKLSRVELAPPPQIIGRNTVESLQSGLYHGNVGLVDHILDGLLATEALREGTEAPVRVVATGGLATLIADGSRHIQTVDPHLTLEGIHLLFERNQAG